MFGGMKRYLQISCSLLCAVMLVVTGCGGPQEEADVPAENTGNSAENGQGGAEIPGGRGTEDAEVPGGKIRPGETAGRA